MIDRETKWLEATPLLEITADAIATAFLETWISRFGVPLHVITDRGSQFESELFQRLSSKIGFIRLRTTSYHPQSNGYIERRHRTLKQALRGTSSAWTNYLPTLLMALRLLPANNGISPFYAVTGTQAMIPVPQESLPVDERFL